MAKTVDYNNKQLHALIPKLDPDCNKYSRAYAAVVAGSKKYPGAAYISARSCSILGCGYTKVFTSSSAISIIQSYDPSIVVDSFSSFLDQSKLRFSACLAGPGLSPDSKKALWCCKKLIKEFPKSIVFDAGALSLIAHCGLASKLNSRDETFNKCILTPHLQEATNLAKAACISPSQDQASLAQSLSSFYNSIVVLKGPSTVIADGENCYIYKDGPACLAKAGTGDVLAGFIVSLLSQGLGGFDACVLACKLHGKCASMAQHDLGANCVLVEDIINSLPKALRRL